MKYYKYSFKCKKCGLVVYSPKLSGDYIDECIHCESKASVLVNPEKAYKFQAEYMPLLEQICGDRLGENPNDPSHTLYRWKA